MQMGGKIIVYWKKKASWWSFTTMTQWLIPLPQTAALAIHAIQITSELGHLGSGVPRVLFHQDADKLSFIASKYPICRNVLEL